MKKLLQLAVAAGMVAILAACGASATPQAQSTTINIQLGDFYFKPDTITLKSGQEVTLHLSNEGQVAHELMIGRGAGMHAAEMGDMQDKGDMHKDEEMGHSDAATHAKSYEHDFLEGVSVQHSTQNASFMVMKGHGTMALLQPGGTATLTFIVPTDKTGEWEVGCFQPGHHEAGMKGKLIVQ